MVRRPRFPVNLTLWFGVLLTALLASAQEPDDAEPDEGGTTATEAALPDTAVIDTTAVDTAAATVVPPAEAAPSAAVVLDANPEPGDQEQRRLGVLPGARFELQLTATRVPPIYGWSTILAFDPQQLSFVSSGFKATKWVPGLVPLVDNDSGQLDVGGVNFTLRTASGDGDLGQVAFQSRPGFVGETTVRLIRARLRRNGSTDKLTLDTPVTVVVTPDSAAIAAIDAAAAAALAARRAAAAAAEEARLAALAAAAQAAAAATDSAATVLAGPVVLPGSLSVDFDAAEAAAAGASGPSPYALAMLRQTKACAGCDLAGALLGDAVLIGAELTRAQLAGANLAATDLGSSKLVAADLTRADLSGANLERADLSGAQLTRALLVNARLADANLTGARLEKTRLQGADLSGALWTDGRRRCRQGSVGRCR